MYLDRTICYDIVSSKEKGKVVVVYVNYLRYCSEVNIYDTVNLSYASLSDELR